MSSGPPPGATVPRHGSLDACVLYPLTLRDTLLRMAAEAMYQLYWSAEILEETRRNLVAKRITEGQATRHMRRRYSGDQAPTSVPQRLHRTVDVPQANRLENIRQLVATVREGIQHPTALLELLQVDQRHLSYYRQAASILGVVEPDAHGTLALTDRGRALLSTAEGSIDERHAFRDAILAASTLQAELTVRGKAAHSARPWQGENAIHKAGK